MQVNVKNRISILVLVLLTSSCVTNGQISCVDTFSLNDVDIEVCFIDSSAENITKVNGKPIKNLLLCEICTGKGVGPTYGGHMSRNNKIGFIQITDNIVDTVFFKVKNSGIYLDCILSSLQSPTLDSKSNYKLIPKSKISIYDFDYYNGEKYFDLEKLKKDFKVREL